MLSFQIELNYQHELLARVLVIKKEIPKPCKGVSPETKLKSAIVKKVVYPRNTQ
ncbi:MAG TPA: hypothetical protein VHO70_08965 [Chitinispirillaceae bacterium]|nr:hypothetical protein [Chitinispirillaceae bacterium]